MLGEIAYPSSCLVKFIRNKRGSGIGVGVDKRPDYTNIYIM